MSKVLPKPEMRNFFARRAKIHLAGATVTSIAAGLAFKFFYADPRKRAHDKFYETYDPYAHEKRMIEYGIFQSIPKPTK